MNRCVDNSVDIVNEVVSVEGIDPRKFFLHYLRQLGNLVECATSHCDSIGSDSLMAVGLTKDMFPFLQQVSTAAGFALRALYPLAGLDIPDLGQPETAAGLKAYIRRADDLVIQLPLESLCGFEIKTIVTRAGFSDRSFSGWDYLHLYAIPNFLFHHSMAYAILRANGVPIGKADFDGFHQYPAGFHFSEE